MKRFLPIVMLLCFLTGCGQEAAPVSYTVKNAENMQGFRASLPEETTENVPVTEPVTQVPTLYEPPADALLPVKTLEVYEAITLGALLDGTNVQLEYPDTPVDTTALGPHEATVSYTFDGQRYEHSVVYTVTDSTAPILLNSGWDAEMELGDAFDLTDYVGFADNYDSAPVLTWEGSVNTDAIGTYPLHATVTDAFGNATSWDVNIRVVEESITPQDNLPRMTFDTLMTQYAGENVRFGIDVSKWQGDIDFEAVKAAGCSFVIMRIGHYYDEIAMDEYYLQNMQRAREAGLEVGIYIYTTANTEEEIRENAAWIAEQLGGQELDFPVVFDWESFTNFQKYGMSIHDLNTLFNVFAEEMEGYGYDSMLYSSKNFLYNFWYPQEKYPVWLAHYTDRTDYTGDYMMWQMSCRGRIHGITGDVDFNILYE